MKLEKKIKPKYPQKHNIRLDMDNPALRQKRIEQIHHRLKYQAKYNASKQNKRLYD